MNGAGEALDQIRETELSAARAVQEARDRAEGILAEARAEARRIRADGARRGREAAQRHLEESIAAAEATAEDVRREGDETGRRLLDIGSEHVDAIAQALLTAVLAPPTEEGK